MNEKNAIADIVLIVLILAMLFTFTVSLHFGIEHDYERFVAWYEGTK